MKVLISISLFLYVLGFNPSFQNQNSIMINASNIVKPEMEVKEVFVNGTCDMCKVKIERIANKVKGVRYATWKKESKILKVKFNTEKTDINAILNKIADAGYDTEIIKATDEAYENLHYCCKYTRRK